MPSRRQTSVENERLCKARAEAKFTWIMPSRRQTSVENERLCKASAEAKLAWTMPSRRQTSVENECIISLFFFADFNSQYPLYLRQRLVDLVVEGLALLEVVGKEFGGGKNLFLVFGKLALVEIAIQLQ